MQLFSYLLLPSILLLLPPAAMSPYQRAVNAGKWEGRLRRQSQEGIFRTYWRLATEASNDTGSAFTQIRDLFSTLIEPSNENIQLVGNASVPEEGNATTTEVPPRRISTGELMSIFRRNVFGLGRLFGREFWNAIQQQSNKNVEMYMNQWREAIRPYLQ